MALFKQEQQQDASLQRPMPVDVVMDSSTTNTIAGEVVAFSFYSGGVLTVDGGQVAGTNVISKFTRTGILNDVGDVIGTNKSTSVNFTAGTALTTEVAFPYLTAELYDEQTGESRLNQVVAKANFGAGLQNGEYCIDYRNGVLYGKKGDATTSMTATYKVGAIATSSGGGPTADVNLDEVGGSPISLGQTTMAGSIPVVLASDQSTISVTTGGASTVLAGTQTVALAGTPVQLTVASTPSKSVVIQASLTNTGDILVGNVTTQAVTLVPGDSASIDIDNLNKVYLDSTVNGEGVNFLGTN